MSKTAAATEDTRDKGPEQRTTYQNHGAYAVSHTPILTAGLPQGVRYGILSEKKSLVEAYLLWLVFGLIGMHHFYLRRPGFGLVYLFTFGILGAGYVIDMFRMAWLVRDANRKLEDRTLENKKNISDTYTLWFPLGLLGFHHFYLRNHGLGALYLLTFGVFGIGWLIDLIRIPYMVKDYNQSTPQQLQEKHVGAAYLLGMSPLGILGFHHFYLNRPGFGLLYFFTFGLLGVGWIFDWFRIPIMVKRANKEFVEGRDPECHLDDAYILWFPLGLTGIHHFYLNRPLWGLMYFFTFGLLGVGWLVDACRIPGLVKDHNKKVKERLNMPIYQTPGVVYVQGTTSPMTSQGYQPQGQPQGAFQNPWFYPTRQGQYTNPTYVLTPPAYQQQYPAQAPSYMEQPPPYYQGRDETTLSTAPPVMTPPTSGALTNENPNDGIHHKS